MRSDNLSLIKILLASLLLMSCARSNTQTSGVCGDGVMDGESEECDQIDMGGITCIKLGYYGGVLKCDDDCRMNITECVAMGRCGDNILHGMYGEQCEGTELGSETCEKLNLGGGTLACDDECNFDVTGCDEQPVCGDGTLDSPVEDCEEGNLGSETCETMGYHGGTLSCTSNCFFDITDCQTTGLCGDGAIQISYEECDTGNLGTDSCESLGYNGGTLSCGSDCNFNTSDCETHGICGDGAIQSSYEECDGASLGGASCLSAGYWYGSVSCNSCNLVTANCEAVRLNGTATDDRTTSLNFNSSGDMFLTGHSGGNYEGVSNAGSLDALFIKYNSDGSLGWNKLIGSTADDTSFDTVEDSSGNIYVVGNTTGNLHSQINSGMEDGFIIKYNSIGVRLWTKLLGTAENDICRYVAIHPDGNIIVSGKTGGSFPGWPTNGLTDIYVAKYNSSGTRLWLKQMGTSADEETLGMDLDSSGNIFISGWTGGSLGGTNSGGIDPFVVKLSSSGIESMMLQWGTSADDYAHEMVLDSTGNIFVVGETAAGMDGNTFYGVNDMFLTKFNSTGTKQWTRQWGSPGNDIGWSVVIDSSSNIYVFGLSEGPVEAIPSNGLHDAILTKFNSAGTIQWVRQYGTNSDDFGLFIDISPTGGIFVTGWSNGSFDGQNYSGMWDLFIMRILNP